MDQSAPRWASGKTLTHSYGITIIIEVNVIIMGRHAAHCPPPSFQNRTTQISLQITARLLLLIAERIILAIITSLRNKIGTCEHITHKKPGINLRIFVLGGKLVIFYLLGGKFLGNILMDLLAV